MALYTLNAETMNELETFSAKLEVFSWLVEHVNKVAWNIIGNYRGKEAEGLHELGSLTEAISDIAALYESKIDLIIKDIQVTE